MKEFIDNSALQQFLDASRRVRYKNKHVAADKDDLAIYELTREKAKAVKEAQRPVPSSEEEREARLEKIREDVAKKVNAMTMDDLLEDLLKANSLCLSKEERDLLLLTRRKTLVQRGAQAPKAAYMNFKELKALRRDEAIRREQDAQLARDASLTGVNRHGKRFAVLTTSRESLRDVTAKKINPRVAEVARQFADGRGYSHVWDGTTTLAAMPGTYAKGELRIPGALIKAVRGSKGKGPVAEARRNLKRRPPRRSHK